jgi:hypothetical protein
MQYPTMTPLEGSMQLAAQRTGAPVDIQAGVKMKGYGVELDQSFVAQLRSSLDELMAEWPLGLKNDKNRNIFETQR